MHGLVCGFLDEHGPEEDGLKETATEKWQRYQLCSMSECSDPGFWQQVHHHNDESEDDSAPSMQDEDWLADYITARNSALRRARLEFEQAEASGNHEMMYH